VLISSLSSKFGLLPPQHAQGGVGLVGVVVVSPVGDEYLGFEQGVELLDGEEFVAHAAAIGLYPGRLIQPIL
jgi:hypothetical protein